MTTEEQTFDAELSAAVAWLTLHPADWCVFFFGTGPCSPYLDVAVDAATVAPILSDLADEGFAVGLDEPARVAQASRHRLRVRLHHGPQFRALARGSVVRRPIFGLLLPVAQVAAAEAALVSYISPRPDSRRATAPSKSARGVRIKQRGNPQVEALDCTQQAHGFYQRGEGFITDSAVPAARFYFHRNSGNAGHPKRTRNL